MLNQILLPDSLTVPGVIEVASVHRLVTAEHIIHSDSVKTHGVYPALLSATIGIDIRDQVIRVVSDDFVGLIGVYYGSTITGATVRGPGVELQGAAALKMLVTLNHGVYDILELKREIVARKLKQSLGLDIGQLISLFDANQDCSLAQIVEQQIFLNSVVTSLTSKLGFEVVSQRLPFIVDFPEGWDENCPIEESFPRPPLRPNLDDVFFFGPDPKTEVAELSWSNDAKSEFDPESLDAIPTPVTVVVAAQNQKLVVIRDLEETLARARRGTADRADVTGAVSRMSTELRMPHDPGNGRSTGSFLKGKNTGSFVKSTGTGSFVKGRTTGSFAAAAAATDRGAQQDLSKESSEIYIDDLTRKSSVDQRKFIDTGRHEAVSFERSRKTARKNFAAIAAAVCVVICFGVGFTMILGANESLSEADSKLRCGDLVGACDLYNKLLAKDPNNFAAYAGRGAAVALQSPDAAVKDYQKALSLKPGATAIREKFADLLLRQGKVAQAIAQAKIILAGEPANVNASRVQGICLIKLGSFSDAIAPLRTALASQSGNRAELCYYLYKATAHIGRKDEAALYIEEAVQLAPTNVRYLIDRARFRISSANYANAMKDLTEAGKLAPLNPEPRYLIGICAYEQSNLKHAIASWTEALNRGFDHPDLYKHRGHALFESGAFAASVHDLDRYLAAKPDDKIARQRRESAMTQVKRTNPSARVIDAPQAKTLRTAVYYGSNAVDSGYKALQAGDDASAVRLLNKAVQADPNNATARKYLAYAHLHSGSMDKAVAQFQAWNYLQPIPPSEMFLFGRTLMKAGKYAQAAQVFDDLVNADPGNSSARVQLIKAFSLAGQTERARSICLKSMSEAKDKTEYESYRVVMP
ncbi:MAG: tetratricopeptide repeat protein [Candidatus Obscuribacterales bacterium]|nr:tetratricopeptide repeat protein [Candidatus Obscuribacterales bacterium]